MQYVPPCCLCRLNRVSDGISLFVGKAGYLKRQITALSDASKAFATGFFFYVFQCDDFFFGNGMSVLPDFDFS